MSKPLYIDTNVIIDFFHDRDSESYQLLIDALSCKYIFIISNHTIKELLKHSTESEINNFVNVLNRKSKMKKVYYTEKHLINARKNRLTHYADALHYEIAKEYKIPIITKNIKDFIQLNTQAYTPKDFRRQQENL